MPDWQLGIDLGTSYTVAAVLEESQVKVIDVESRGQSRIPSVVFYNTDGDILVGTAAQQQAVFAPDRFEPSPKRCIADGEVFLGDKFVPVAELMSAVLLKVYTEACRQHGEVVPSATRVTHPAEWAEARLNVLRGAVEGAGLPHAVLVPEPVAAAAWIAMAKTAPGRHIAVYDFGGGTFDAAVLRRTDEGFDVAGPPSGRDPLGGEDLDRLIIDHVGGLLADEHPEEWAALINPPDASWRRSATGLRAEVQRAKETLSDVLVCQLWVPGIEREVQLTRTELDALIGPAIDETVNSLTEAIEAAGLEPSELDGIYLVGGSSRIPLVADTIWRTLEIQPAVQDSPKSVVAMGAAAWGSSLHDAAARAHAQLAERASALAAASIAEKSFTSAGKDSETRFRSHLALVKGAGAEERGSTFTALLVVDHPGGVTIRLRDEPARGRDVMTLSQEILQVRSSRMSDFKEVSVEPMDVLGTPGGFERRFSASTPGGPTEMFERYLAVGGRVFVLACPERAREVADSIEMTDPTLANDRYFEARFTLDLPDGWTASERLNLTQAGSGHQVIADHVLAPTPVSLELWRGRQVSGLVRQVPGAEVVSSKSARILNKLDGEEVLIRSGQGRSTLLTKLWLAILDDRNAYEITISLPEHEQALFATLAAIALINPRVVPRPSKLAATVAKPS